MSLPITVRHVYDFGADRPLVGEDLGRPEAWDALRTGSTGAFALPADRSRWEALAAGRPDIAGRAAALDAWLAARDIRSLASYGVGGAALELLLFRAGPERRIVLSDYAPATVERLESVFPEAAVRRRDLRVDPPLDAELHLFHRIDTEFPNRVWRSIFDRFASAHVLFIAADLVGVRGAAAELRRRRRDPRLTSAGWLRNRAAMERLWASTHDATRLQLHDLHAWDLRPRVRADVSQETAASV